MHLISFFVASVVIFIDSASKPQFGNYDQFWHNPSVNFQPIFSQNYRTNKKSNTFNSNDNFFTQNRQGTDYEEISSACSSYWSYQNDFSETWGRITIPKPFRQQSVIRIELSVGARLPTVRKTFKKINQKEKIPIA